MTEPLTVRESREVAGFRAIDLRYFGQLHLTQGAEPAVEVEGDPDVVAKVRSRVVDGTLVLEIGESWLERLTSGVLLVAHRPLHYFVTVPELDRVSVTGAGKVDAGRFEAQDLDLNVSGAAEVAIQELHAQGLRARISGRGTFRLAGRAEQLDLRISGSGDVDAGALACDDASVRISGQGSVEVRVATRLDVRISGLGTVRYHGDPALTQSISGSGTVARVGAGGPIEATPDDA